MSDRQHQKHSTGMVSPYENHSHQINLKDSAGLEKNVIHHVDSGLNPITDAAAPIFTLLGNLKTAHSAKKLNQLHNTLSKEIHTFQTKAKNQGYSSEQILIARYALCASCDDIITHQPWVKDGAWAQYSLLKIFHPDHALPERFFIILQRLSKEPALFIDVLELMYLCLVLGFYGPYRLQIDENEYLPTKTLVAIIEKLYQVIRAYRGDCKKLLSPFYMKELTRKSNLLQTILNRIIWSSGTLLAVIVLGLSSVIISKLYYISSAVEKTTVKQEI